MDFWTYSCVNCIRTLPYLRAWNARYAGAGLVIVGVHTPEFAFEHVVGNVKRAVGEHDIRYPVAVDDDYGTWNAYGNQYWPADYLIDRNGHIRDAHFGEGAYADTESKIRTLLGERASAPRAAPKGAITASQTVETPETYLGAERGTYSQKVYAGEEFDYTPDAKVFLNQVQLKGTWRLESQKLIAGPGAHLLFQYTAPRIYVVAAPPASGPGPDLGDHRRQGAARAVRAARRPLPADPPSERRAAQARSRRAQRHEPVLVHVRLSRPARSGADSVYRAGGAAGADGLPARVRT